MHFPPFHLKDVRRLLVSVEGNPLGESSPNSLDLNATYIVESVIQRKPYFIQ